MPVHYYDADFDYSTIVKISHLPNVDFLQMLNVEKEYLKMHQNEPQKYYSEIKKIIINQKILEHLKNSIEKNYHLHRRREIFTDLTRLYEEKHFQSFIALGLLQIEGLFFDICSIRYDKKENAGTLIEKAQKALKNKNEVSFMRYYPYFAFDIPVKRNEIAHTGLIQSENLKKLADELLLDINAVVRMAIRESDEKFRIFIMIYNTLCELDSDDENNIYRKLVLELFMNNFISPDSFWEVLKNPEQFKDEIEFYKIDNLENDCVDLPFIVNYISEMVYSVPFWNAMLNLLNTDNTSIKHENNQFFMKMAKDYVSVLDKECKEICIEILKTLK